MESLFRKTYLRPFRAADLVVAAGVLALLYSILHLSKALAIPFHPGHGPGISLSPFLLPYYAGESLLRMFAAYVLSLLFSLVYGYACAYSRLGEKLLIPLLDILQSVPILGFLSITVTGFTSLFPGNLIGLELASIFAVFTSQAWNITFSFYHSLRAIPEEFQEASRLYRLNPWQRFSQLELPHAMGSLVWNSMLSFGGSWIFLTASEAITVYGRQVELPGLGSYLATAIAGGDLRSIFYALAAMVVVIIALDQFFWRPLLAWASRYAADAEDADAQLPASSILTILRRSHLIFWFQRTFIFPLAEQANRLAVNLFTFRSNPAPAGRSPARLVTGTAFAVLSAYLAYRGLALMVTIPAPTVWPVFLMGLATFGRVAAATALSVIWAVPAGVYIGLHGRVSRWARPLAQILASFPINMLFPFFTIVYLRYHINFPFVGSVLLMMLGTQWYILFNVIAGAQAIPEELREAGAVMGLSRASRWRDFLLPAIFPALITGGITAAGNAWNTSILAEVVAWKGHSLTAFGLGSYITTATGRGDNAALLLGIVVMSILVVLANRFVWHPLSLVAQAKYRL